MQRLLGISQSLKQERRWHDLTSQYNLDEALAFVATRMMKMDRSLRAIAIASGSITAAGAATYLGAQTGLKTYSKMRYSRLLNKATQHLKDSNGKDEALAKWGNPEVIRDLSSKNFEFEFFAKFSKSKNELETLRTKCAEAIDSGDLWEAKKLLDTLHSCFISIENEDGVARWDSFTRTIQQFALTMKSTSIKQLKQSFNTKATKLHFDTRKALISTLNEDPPSLKKIQDQLEIFKKVRELGVSDYRAKGVVEVAELTIQLAELKSQSNIKSEESCKLAKQLDYHSIDSLGDNSLRIDLDRLIATFAPNQDPS
jgi:hypothetical protein